MNQANQRGCSTRIIGHYMPIENQQTCWALLPNRPFPCWRLCGVHIADVMSDGATALSWPRAN